MNEPDRSKCGHNLDTVSGICIIKLYYQIIIDIFGMKVKLDLILKIQENRKQSNPKTKLKPKRIFAHFSNPLLSMSYWEKPFDAGTKAPQNRDQCLPTQTQAQTLS